MRADVREAAALLAEAAARGVWIRRDPSGSLRVGPTDRLDPTTLQDLRLRKEALLALFSTPAPWSCLRCGRHRFAQPTLCYWCRRTEERPGYA